MVSGAPWGIFLGGEERGYFERGGGEEEEEGSVVLVVISRARDVCKKNTVPWQWTPLLFCPRRLFVSPFLRTSPPLPPPWVRRNSQDSHSNGRTVCIARRKMPSSWLFGPLHPSLEEGEGPPPTSLQTSAVKTDTSVRSWLPPSEFQGIATLQRWGDPHRQRHTQREREAFKSGSPICRVCGLVWLGTHADMSCVLAVQQA